MSFLIAPYNNAMRLGQGFNSYTQTICIDRAVSFPGTVTTNPASATSPPDRVPQVVSYSSQFIDKTTDVQKGLSVSAALRIDSGGFSGAGSGSYVDESKIRESDLNYIIRVNVTNQTTQISGNCTFIEVPGFDRSKFKEVYGDSFISGFIEGGELLALMNTKITDQSHTLGIKARIEAGYMGISVIGGVSWSTSSLDKDSITSISVNWCGGGQIKDNPSTPWDIDAMFKAAAAFPYQVAQYPTRTYAILTKYTSITSFVQNTIKFESLSYENATIYTGVLYNDFMDYKRIFKDLIIMRTEPFYYTKSTAKDAYDLTRASLDKLQADVRMHMDAITKEVEVMFLNPALANDYILRDNRVAYLPPSIFTGRLPVRKPDIDASGWMWVRLPGKDSPGNDIMNFGNGFASPEELMQKAYEWEKAHPGQYVKGFNTTGSLKSKLVHTSQFTTPPTPQGGPSTHLYVRILIDSNWYFIPGSDSPGADFVTGGFTRTTDDSGDIDIVDSLKTASGNSQIVAFNSYGWTKNQASFPPSRQSLWNGKPHMGLWVKKSTLLMS